MSERYTLPNIDGLDAVEREIRKTIELDIPATAAERYPATAPTRPPTIDETLYDRNSIHGDFTDDAGMAQGLKNLMRTGKNWGVLKPCQAECLEQIQTKIARILAGDPNHPDHWRDLQGYPRLVEERL